MAVSENLSSARVAPRSETFASATSSMIASSVAARDITAPVQLASPTVRKRTEWRSTVSFLRGFDERTDREVHAVAHDDVALVGEVDLWQRHLLALDVLPHVELGPVREWEGAQALAGIHLALVDLPEFGSLLARVPLAEGVAEGQDAFLGARLVLVAARAAEGGVEVVVVDRVEQRHRLEAIARTHGAGVLDLALVDRVLHLGDDEARADARDGGVAELDDLGEVLTGVDVQHRKRELLGREGLDREVQQHRRVLAAGEEQDRAFALRDHLSEDENGVGLQQVEVVGGGGSAQGCRRHSPCGLRIF